VLAKEYGVSRHTIRRAFQDLIADELVHRTRGRGTFAVSPGELYVKQLGSIDDLMALSEDTQMEISRLSPVRSTSRQPGSSACGPTSSPDSTWCAPTAAHGSASRGSGFRSRWPHYWPMFPSWLRELEARLQLSDSWTIDSATRSLRPTRA
jgi:hypothetical protein